MDRGSWRARVHGIAKSLTTERLTLSRQINKASCADSCIPPNVRHTKSQFVKRTIHRERAKNHRDKPSIKKYQLPSYFREGNGTPLQYSCLENPMDGGAWWAAVHGVAKSRTWLRDFTFTFYFHTLEKEMATHSSILAWRIPGTGEPGGLPSTGSHRIGHHWSDSAAAAAAAQLFTTN